MRPTTEKGFREKIREAARGCGTYREEFEPLITRLADVYIRIRMTKDEFKKSGSSVLIKHTNKSGATNFIKNPLLKEIDDLMKMALEMEKEMGLTPSSLRKVNEAAMPSATAENNDPLREALGKMGLVS